MRWYVRETTYYDENASAVSDPDEWDYVGEFPTLADVLRQFPLAAPVCLTNPENSYGGAYVDLYTLNRYLGLPKQDTSMPVDEKYDRLDETGLANVIVYDIAEESVLAADVIQSAQQRYRP
ncbi:hypothetical protein Sulac_1159 [Sulfobacillus acidophilus DSM 10332]|uniref:Uncharacterized protein n=1 Tax=Sulfobacillus acidophilus (strain ATCC 700253 / DSM 10332 / NAL) TaxID=679936 RepID=G8TUL2_SULAD|nr:hypothetical protein Sulac_1159 [Sulfobacillus acidophilus DSM 10332]